MGEEATSQANLLESKLSGKVSSEFHDLSLLGIPIAVKDNICVEGGRATCASKILENYIPSYDATAVCKLKQAGAIIVGKTNMDEFAMGSTTENSGFQDTRNPWSLAHSPGGSSGGSAAVVASGQVMASLGSDTGGSVRQPAAWCGVVGLKPTYGRVSRNGLVAYASSTDCIGPIGRNVKDVALLTSVLSGGDVKDPTSQCRPALELDDMLSACSDTALSADKPLKGVRVGVISETMMSTTAGGRTTETVSSSVSEAVTALKELGATISEVSFPLLKQQCAAYYVYVLSEASANLARFDGVRYGNRVPGCESTRQAMTRTREEGFGPEVRERIILGTFSLSSGYQDAYYGKAVAMVRQLSHSLDTQLGGGEGLVDMLLCPTAPCTAYRLGDKAKQGVEGYADDLFTVPASLAGLPALSLPCGLSEDGLPIGFQLIGPKWSEATLFRAAYAYEQKTEKEAWRHQKPAIFHQV
eukprot:CAMPEP_0182436624 /NCGR_PEP_ID=MMETSP1167-20130531/82515_1 /TAXON_ID=2988 /ORGANISM="Mallomonas Sp, Strain CCMP3275" /LENGTH=470 /DNA_ID=CAMNT_0024628971 /DNA_START=319 /DNA_END=1731 /DNA_ORIENTATION=+